MELELPMVVSQPVGVGNQTRVLFRTRAFNTKPLLPNLLVFSKDSVPVTHCLPICLSSLSPTVLLYVYDLTAAVTSVEGNREVLFFFCLLYFAILRFPLYHSLYQNFLLFQC